LLNKILCTVLSLLIVFSSLGITVSAEGNIDNYIEFVSNFNIINGDGNGNYRLDDYVTRAEFTKIAVAASSYRDSVASNIFVSPFKDVPYTHWSAPYVKVAVDAGIVNGYEDATFKPDNLVSYEEGLTMLLKLLGYTNDDFGSSWPYAQISIAKNKNITENISKNIGDALTRKDAVILVYNLLNAKKKDGNTKYITEFDSQIIEDVVLLSTAKEDTSVGANKIATSVGTYKIGFNFDENDLGKKGDIVVKDQDTITSFIPSNQIIEEYEITSVMGSDIVLDGKILDVSENTLTYHKSKTITYKLAVSEAKRGDTFKVFKNSNGVTDYGVLVSKNILADFDVLDISQYVVYSVLNDKVLAYNNGIIQQIDFTNSVTVYEDENKVSSYQQIKQNMEMGDILNVKYDKYGDIEYVVYEEGNLKGPLTVSNMWYTKYEINPESVKVIKDGKQSDFASLNTYDIAYYISDMDMILAYSKKVVGIYESASPNKDTLTSVTVSGVTYEIESATAFSKLSSSGTFNFGDTVTLLLGKNGEIADVVSDDTALGNISGYLTKTGKKTYKNSNGDNYTSYYACIVDADGVEGEYKVDRDYKDYINKVVLLTYQNSVGKISVYSSTSDIYGKVDYASMKLGNKKLSDDISILEIYSTNTGSVTNYNKTYVQRLDNLTLASSDIYYVEYNKQGEICKLIIKDITGDMHLYALAVEVNSSEEGNMVSYKFSTNIGTVSSSGIRFNSVRKNMPIKLLTDKNQTNVDGALNLIEIDFVKSVNQSFITDNNGKQYKVSPQVLVMKKTTNAYTSEYEIVPISEIENGDFAITAYADKAEEKGGRVRVILATYKN